MAYYITATIAKGDTVTFNDKFGTPLTGIIVSGTYWRHICGGSLQVWVRETASVYRIDLYTHQVTHNDDNTRDALFSQARQEYIGHLSQYPIWRHRFDSGYMPFQEEHIS